MHEIRVTKKNLFMKKQLFIIAALCLAQWTSAQTVLYTENFQSGGNNFTLNTTDLNSTSAGANSWAINNAYTGGSGSIVCLGIPATFTVPNTPSQPGPITGSPNSSYLHTVSDAAIQNGINNCCFLAADGFCVSAERYFAKMNTDISTIGYDTIRISFWWLCVGGNNSYGELYYSTDGGSNWNQVTTVLKYNNTSNWTQQTITLPAFANKPTLRFGFRFVNLVTFSANDPGFAIDEIKITGVQNVPVAGFTASDTAFCQESCIAFTDQSTNNPTSWQWTFQGAQPDTSTLQNPTQICYTQPGTYDVTLVVSNGIATDTLHMPGYIHVYANPPIPNVTISANGDTLCTDPGYIYQWYFGNGIPIPGQTSMCYAVIFPGSYYVMVTDAQGCFSFSNPVVISGLNELHSEHEIEIYPQPVSNELFIRYSQPGLKVTLSDVSGRFVRILPVYENELYRIKVSHLMRGLYFLQIENSGIRQIKKVVIQ